MKLHMHHHSKVVYTHYKFHEIPLIARWLLAEDKKIHGIMKTKGQLLFYYLGNPVFRFKQSKGNSSSCI